MAGVVTDACIKCKYMDCVEVCPVDAFYEGATMLVISPLECVDCGCCIERCPIDAIVFEGEPRAEPWRELNATYAKLWPNVTFDGGQTPADADQFHTVTDKFERYFSPEPGTGDIGTPVRPVPARSCSRCDSSEGSRMRRAWITRMAALLISCLFLALILAGKLL